MKTIFNKIFISISVSLFMVSCGTEDMKFKNADVTAVQNLYEPSDGKALKLTAQGSTYFSWEPAKSQDGGAALYEVLFDRVGGNFSQPVYVMASDNSGYDPAATISHKTLNNVASLSGVEMGGQANLIWTVRSSRGINMAVCSQSRQISFERLSGFDDDDIPGEVYITGSATEGGTNLSAALPFKLVERGIYEIYTKLTSGETYQFVSSKSDSDPDFKVYYADGLIKESELGTDQTVVTQNTGVYRITLDFTLASITFVEINSVSYYYPQFDDEQLPLDYIGQGVWSASGELSFQMESWGLEERYTFRAHTTDSSGNTAVEVWGTLNGTDSGPSEESGPYYYIKVYPYTGDVWANKWKFSSEYRQRAANAPGYKLDFTMTVYMQGDSEYTHTLSQP